MENHQLVLVLDFGGQYNQLIARRVREHNVYCEVKPYKTSIEEIKALNPIGIIFTGGPNSVYEEKSPKCDPALFELGVPVLGICYGMPSFGEGGAADETAVARIREALAPYPLHVVNDVEVGWAGSMALAPGVNIVAGTGSIAYGRDEAGNSARSGGWMEFFSDEGSGYWLGRRAFQLFAKQSDGRVPRGRLHALMKARLGLEDDYELNNLVRDVYAPSREKTASIQRILLEAAREGDASAVRLYEEAARELAENVNAVLRQLRLGDTPTVSYSGGIFETGDLILKPFRAALDASVQVMKPVWGPAEGALLLAVEQFAPRTLPTVKNGLCL